MPLLTMTQFKTLLALHNSCEQNRDNFFSVLMSTKHFSLYGVHSFTNLNNKTNSRFISIVLR